MQEDFHYYATYCAAQIAGWSHEDSLAIAYSAQLVDCCTETFLSALHAPLAATTTQSQLELAEARTDVIGLQEITRIWASFHFLPGDLNADPGKGGRRYKNKYRLICDVNGPLVKETVDLAKDHGLAAAGLAMHVLADTWAHRYFAGTPSLVINSASAFEELIPGQDGPAIRPVRFLHSLSAPDALDTGHYVNSLHQLEETSIMNLGHGRAGHLPDYSCMQYRFMPAWNNYETIIKNNPLDYYQAFCQMVYALQYLHGDIETFETNTYAYERVAPYDARIKQILMIRRLSAADDWEAFGKDLSGREVEPFSLHKCEEEYLAAPDGKHRDTFLGHFVLAALAQKSMLTNRVHGSGNPLAGISVKYSEKGIRGIRDFRHLLQRMEGRGHE